MRSSATRAAPDTALREDLRKAFTIPHSIAGTFTGLVGFAPILLLILAASIMGTEYGWGTLRTTLTRGTGRWQLLASKLVLVLLACAAGFIIVAVLVAVASLIAAVIPPDEVNRLDAAGKWSDIALNFIKAVYALAPYIALGTFLAVLCAVLRRRHLDRPGVLRYRAYCPPPSSTSPVGARTSRTSS